MACYHPIWFRLVYVLESLCAVDEVEAVELYWVCLSST